MDWEGIKRGPRGDPQGNSPVYRLYKAKDGQWFFLALGNLTFFTKFAVSLSHEEWLTDPLFEGAPFLILPPRNRQARDILQGIFSSRSRDEWLEFLRAHDIPCSPALSVAEFMDDPQVQANEMVKVVEQPPLGKVRQMGVPIKFPLAPGGIKGPAPALGQHTEEVLGGLGYSAREIARLKSSGVV
jgi:crotonobetainyl-CoA:carnitine CoA-transferase CaiB-like acyl-CoA transferase